MISPDDPPLALRLQLLRHAKSDRDQLGVSDINRDLSSRGHSAAKAMGQAIARKGLVPDLVLCSPARRAQETWSLASGAFPRVPETRTIDSLYDFGDGSRLLEIIETHGRNAKRLMLIGHNPSLEELAKRLIVVGPPKLRQQLETKFPTAAMAVIEFRQSHWSELAEQTGRLTHFMRPVDIMGET